MERDFLCAIGRKEKGSEAVKEESRAEPDCSGGGGPTGMQWQFPAKSGAAPAFMSFRTAAREEGSREFSISGFRPPAAVGDSFDGVKKHGLSPVTSQQSRDGAGRTRGEYSLGFRGRTVPPNRGDRAAPLPRAVFLLPVLLPTLSSPPNSTTEATRRDEATAWAVADLAATRASSRQGPRSPARLASPSSSSHTRRSPSPPGRAHELLAPRCSIAPLKLVHSSLKQTSAVSSCPMPGRLHWRLKSGSSSLISFGQQQEDSKDQTTATERIKP